MSYGRLHMLSSHTVRPGRVVPNIVRAASYNWLPPQTRSWIVIRKSRDHAPAQACTTTLGHCLATGNCLHNMSSVSFKKVASKKTSKRH
ncbi:hypothetical protein VTO73DRAFT_15160 [Trametes versicolor]